MPKATNWSHVPKTIRGGKCDTSPTSTISSPPFCHPIFFLSQKTKRLSFRLAPVGCPKIPPAMESTPFQQLPTSLVVVQVQSQRLPPDQLQSSILPLPNTPRCCPPIAVHILVQNDERLAYRAHVCYNDTTCRLTPDAGLNAKARLVAPDAAAASPSRESHVGAFAGCRRRVRPRAACAAGRNGLRTLSAELLAERRRKPG
jgi:hypothetical protein